MRFTVAVPCYNGARYLARTIESVLAQSYPAHQVLVVDDGSTDDSAAVAAAHAVTLIKHAANLGLAAARNTALAHATGDVLAFVDVDALAAPNMLEALLAGYGLGGDPLAGVGGQGVEVNIHTAADRWRRAHASQGYGPRPRFVPYLCGLCMSYHASVLREAGGFDAAYRTNAEDMDIGLRLTGAGYRLRYAPQAQVFHQRQDDTASLTRTISAWYGAAYHARRKNRARPWTLFAGTFRRLFADTLYDLLVLRDPAVARLTLAMCAAKFKALWRAARSARREA